MVMGSSFGISWQWGAHERKYVTRVIHVRLKVTPEKYSAWTCCPSLTSDLLQHAYMLDIQTPSSVGKGHFFRSTPSMGHHPLEALRETCLWDKYSSSLPQPNTTSASVHVTTSSSPFHYGLVHPFYQTIKLKCLQHCILKFDTLCLPIQLKLAHVLTIIISAENLQLMSVFSSNLAWNSLKTNNTWSMFFSMKAHNLLL